MQTLVDLLIRHGYSVVFGWVLAEQVGLPLPAEPFLLASGGVAGSGRLSLPLILLAASSASLIADTMWYWIGRLAGMRVIGWLCRITLEPDSCVRRTERAFSGQGARSLVVAKFIPGLNTAAPPLAGVLRMPLAQFIGYSAIGAVVWSSAWVGLGFIFSEQLELAAAYATRLGDWLFVLVVGAAVGYIAWKYVARQRFLRKIRIARITPDDLKAMLDSGEPTMVVDVRDRLDFDSEPFIIPGALHLPTEDLEARHVEIPRDRDIILYCT
jgi:membrane protein DedA with SNARE-associated domain